MGTAAWALCGGGGGGGGAAAAAKKGAAAPTLSSGGELYSGDALGWVCASMRVGAAVEQEARLQIQVASIAQVRLYRAADGALFDGGVTPGVDVTLCARAFDALGEPFVDAALPEGWLQLGVAPAGSLVTFDAAAADEGASGRGGCVRVHVAAEEAWAARATAAVVASSISRPPPRQCRPVDSPRCARLRAALDARRRGRRERSAAPSLTNGTQQGECAAAAANDAIGGGGDEPAGGALAGLLNTPPSLIAAALVVLLVFAALADLRRSTRRPLPKLNPRDGPSLRGPYSPRHAAAAQAASAKS